jgi:hypothetical protein
MGAESSSKTLADNPKISTAGCSERSAGVLKMETAGCSETLAGVLKMGQQVPLKCRYLLTGLHDLTIQQIT